MAWLPACARMQLRWTQDVSLPRLRLSLSLDGRGPRSIGSPVSRVAYVEDLNMYLHKLTLEMHPLDYYDTRKGRARISD